MSEDEEQLRRLDREWNEAYPACDLGALERIMADDWVGIDGAGLVITRKQLLDRVAAAPFAFDSHEFDEATLRVFGDAAISTGRLSGRGRDTEGPFYLQQRFTRVYVRRGDCWRAVATQVTVVADERAD